MGSRSSWGSVRKLPSGRYQARYCVEGQLVAAPTTFRTKRDAEVYLSTVRADIERGHWVDPAARQVSLGEYATRWLDLRPGLRPRTLELYESELRLHILPALGDLELTKITPTTVREWHAGMLRAGTPGRSTVAKCYRLLRAILNTAVADELILRNPCVINGAGTESAPERPIASIPQVFDIAEVIEPRFRAMVLIGAFVGLRLGEMLALTRGRVDLDSGAIRVVEQYQELKDGTWVLGPPKSAAGVRRVAIPELLVPELAVHLDRFAAAGRDGLLFPGTHGQPVRRAAWYRAWGRALATIGIEGMKPHDLRHTGNTLAAMTGASTKELMARFGQSTSRAALIYQHATRDRDQQIADGLNGMIDAHLKQRPARRPDVSG
ncbi:tyrosine-type recombinase/integrase [Actinomarinicola tropica]|uniref:Tyrosine-type recombinase/integrase n=1 Tax=Actinomarinicola tropica TaxID=2789776 RepID=A0A5Q2RLT1_9ACTN|nr:tyrosine-type recombinase/integrase [Actinomarinicola tropica]QGG96793.1 tyrosine-type recombinase/integrase [Actinomarinicola tropica]